MLCLAAGCAAPAPARAVEDEPSRVLVALPAPSLVQQSVATQEPVMIAEADFEYGRRDDLLGSEPVPLPQEWYDIRYKDRSRTSSGRPVESLWLMISTRRVGTR